MLIVYVSFVAVYLCQFLDLGVLLAELGEAGPGFTSFTVERGVLLIEGLE